MIQALQGLLGGKAQVPLRDSGMVDAKGKVEDSLCTALQDNTLSLPDELAAQQAEIADVLKKLAGGLVVKNADERTAIKTRQAIL